MASDKMDYEDMIPGALRALMVTALGEISSQGLDGDHHFYITYHTTHDGVEMPDQLRAQYPETITIVLQHEFWDLVVEDQGFSVSLAFNGVPHQLAVPFDAVIGFADPSVNFGIQFNTPQGERQAEPAPSPIDEAPADSTSKSEADIDSFERKPGDVITLDQFRKK